MINYDLLDISNVNFSIKEKKILCNLNLNIKLGEIHIIMGPNGAGKSSLAKILTGRCKNYDGKILYNNIDISLLSPDQLALRGVFLSFQYPVIIPGLTTMQFLKSFINCKRKYENKDPIDTLEFLGDVENVMQKLDMNKELLYRFVNDGFSGGEKKKCEILQMLMLKPKFSILDEVDSGLDIDSLKNVANGINMLKSKNNSFLIITHYNRILNYIDVDYVHILHDGKIVKTGGKELAFELENVGYSMVSDN